MEQGTEFSLEHFSAVIAEIFDVSESSLQPETDLSEIIKDSIDLGELSAVLKSRYHAEAKDWELFKTKTSLQEVFGNFEVTKNN